jgi:hypothetical protein
MDQRAVDAFSAAPRRAASRGNVERRNFDHQKRSQTLSSAEAGITHRLHQPLRPRDLAGQQRIRQQLRQQGFGILCGLVQSFRKVCSHGGHLGIAPDQFGRTIVDGTPSVNSAAAPETP